MMMLLRRRSYCWTPNRRGGGGGRGGISRRKASGRDPPSAAPAILLLVVSFAAALLRSVAAVVAVEALSSSSGSGASASNHPNNKPKRSTPATVVVVGGGPVGLAAALTLARSPPHNNYGTVQVLERSSGATSVAAYDPARSYLYNVNARGLEWFTATSTEATGQRALRKLQERGVGLSGFGKIVTVPADPAAPIQLPRPATVGATPPTKAPLNRTSYWIPRHEMVALLTECCHEHNSDNQNSGDAGDGGGCTIEIYNGKEVDTLSTTKNGDDDETITVHCRDGSTYAANLVVAADGIDSQVRQFLANATAPGAAAGSDDSWLFRNHDPRKFRVKRYRSPSTGLKLKALQLPPNFTIPNSADGSALPTESTTIYALRGRHTGSRTRLSLGLLPMRNASAVRPANTNTPFDHELWSLTTGAACKAWFRDAFPRLNFDDWNISDAEWDRFAAARGTTFPPCQYSPGSVVVSPPTAARGGGRQRGIVLVGDACHAFPPDIGQGINAGLQDVVVLDRALRGCRDLRPAAGGAAAAEEESATAPAPSLATALARYQADRGPEHRALIRLARFGAPYQYRQPWRRHRLGRMLWTANVAIRLLLHKLTFGAVPQAAILLAQGNQLTFRQVMRRADVTTWALRLLVALPVLVRWVIPRAVAVFLRTTAAAG